MYRPMYIDSTDNGMPAGENPVAELLKDELESLLKVTKHFPVLKVS